MLWIHHLTNHFPIVTFIISAFLFAVGAARHRADVVRIGGWVVGIGLGAGVIAVISGWSEMHHLLYEESGIAEWQVRTHQWLGLSTAALALATFGLWLRWKTVGEPMDDKLRWGLTGMGVLTALCVIATGHAGGAMLHPDVNPFDDRSIYNPEGHLRQNLEQGMEGHAYGNREFGDETREREIDVEPSDGPLGPPSRR